MHKNNILVYICIAIFGILGVYLTFFSGNVSKYDNQVKAYKIDLNEHYNDDDNTTTYNPTYHYKVNGRDYTCESNYESGFKPKNDIVYYDSSDPTKCKTGYEKSSSRLGGIICLVATAIMLYFFVFYKPSTNKEIVSQNQQFDESKIQVNPEQAEKVIKIVNNVQLVYKRVIIGIIITLLGFFTLIDTAIFKQTLVSRNYPEAIATYVDKISDSEDTISEEYIYTFVDKNEKQQEIVVYFTEGETVEENIKIKYNENNPQNYYTKGMLMDTKGIIWYIVKIVAIILLVILFSNKKMLSKINISAH